jgi:hypothetical protein
MDYYNYKLRNKIIKAARGQRDAMFHVARRMNILNDALVIPNLVTSTLLGSILLSSQVQSVKILCSCIAFLNVFLITLQKVLKPGEKGELFQTYGRKWDLFALGLSVTHRWKNALSTLPNNNNNIDNGDNSSCNIHSASMIEKYNNMIDQSPLLPRWAIDQCKDSNDALSSDEDEELDLLTIKDETHLTERGEGLRKEKETDPGKTGGSIVPRVPKIDIHPNNNNNNNDDQLPAYIYQQYRSRRPSLIIIDNPQFIRDLATSPTTHVFFDNVNNTTNQRQQCIDNNTIIQNDEECNVVMHTNNHDDDS